MAIAQDYDLYLTDKWADMMVMRPFLDVCHSMFPTEQGGPDGTPWVTS